MRLLAVFGAALPGLVVIAVGALSQEGSPIKIVPRLTGAAPPMAEVKAPPLDRPIIDDVRRMRNYPEQPPIIPHSIDGYQLTLNTNRCLSCHRREFTEGSGAPMISVTHFMDRDGQVLSDVTPRRSGGCSLATMAEASRKRGSCSSPAISGRTQGSAPNCSIS